MSELEAIGVVIIGRNEGERLKRCLTSVRGYASRAVYVDSGSRDGSVAFSRESGFDVIELDRNLPFTAARARNEGFERLLSRRPATEFVFFVDGDCEVSPGWLDLAGKFISQQPEVAAVFGRRRERFPTGSVYNLLCDMEWENESFGETKACGGDVLMRVCSFRQVGGYRSDLICGEEPELCVRLRQAGWRIWCLDAEMTLHDAAMYRFGQWWKRMVRGGYGSAIGFALHGAAPERHGARGYLSAWIWGLVFPVCVFVSTYFLAPRALLLLLVYPLQVMRLALKGKRSTRENWLRALALVGGKFPEMLGQMKYALDHYGKRRIHLIEYK